MGTLYLGYNLTLALRQLASIRDYYAGFPSIRRAAVAIGNPGTDNDLETILQNIVAYVKLRVRYVPDPVGFEYVTAPDVLLFDTLQQGVGYGDCDDHVLLLNTLLCSIGIPTKFVAVKMSATSDLFDHVISSAQIDGSWIDVDPCAKHVPQPLYLQRYEQR